MIFAIRCVRGRRKDSTAQAFLQNILKDCSEGGAGGQLRDLMMDQRKDSASLQKKGKKKNCYLEEMLGGLGPTICGHFSNKCLTN